MDKPTATLSEALQLLLDDLGSPRTSTARKIAAVKELERQLAIACASSMFEFMALQYTFECNVPLRLLHSISTTTILLEPLIGKSDRQSECQALVALLTASLSLLQGVVLNHPNSKSFANRKSSLEILLDLFLAARHLPPSEASLSSAIIDTLLCILVDNSPGLRTFELANGPQAVVKILKRAGTPRDVRMKCLEFIYFYLLEESPNGTLLPPKVETTEVDRPLSPTKPQPKGTKPRLVPAPRKPMSVYGSSTFSIPSNVSRISIPSSDSSDSSRSVSSSSSSSGGADTDVTSPPSSPSKSNFAVPSPRLRKDNRGAPCTPNSMLGTGKSKSLFMLKKEVDFTPSTPARSNSAPQPSGTPGNGQNKSRPLNDGKLVRSMEEKKEILGTMLGNVDALVEGVRKAGIWGLNGS